ncbi:hypothetical protein Kpol_221p3 [Vanderwaltozyma polyspora DSM 70294]|uniref:Telomeric single stranded DNA binding POT1/Cdc13 domain-containing protein n=1 Tax=Vanderwaltozyma polyspora (strain ATCC 22028 / DSM 70294 / BCRC 21397 / CBS 2163 / NBRC 10782 / NRRL Y-8283 / UCD 57-17) TaxID=436907 RepID=A7TTI3_VANPO|nr:uncharacterized protein Kpol_221p3 [Vanderwaltozyma polyspora DSM 70294]EDO14425.1 hypothetical protein Kpol_221p3 [Vanderwaltozyma polyspora DSM 70294]
MTTRQFYGLLTCIKVEENKFRLTLHDGDHLYSIFISDDPKNYQVAKICASLICRFYNIEIEFEKQPYQFAAIHLTKICILQLQVYNSKNSIDDIKPLNLETVTRFVKSGNEEVTNIIKYLIDLDQDSTESFSFDEIPFALPEDFVLVIDSLKSNELSFLSRESSGFNGQVKSEIDDEYFDTAQSSVSQIQRPATSSAFETFRNVERNLSKKRKLSEIVTSPAPIVAKSSVFIDAPLGEVHSITGTIAGTYPSDFKDLSDLKDTILRLYIIPREWETEAERQILIPNSNCIEVLILDASEIHKFFGRLVNDSQSFREVISSTEFFIRLERAKLQLENSFHTFYWTFQTVNISGQSQNTSIQNLDPSSSFMPSRNLLSSSTESIPPTSFKPQQSTPNKNDRKNPSRIDPLIQFKDLVLNESEIKYVTMMGLLVSCSFEHKSFAKLIFTDFTKNNVTQNFLFDRFLIDYNNKIDIDEGFRVVMYLNQFEKFEKSIIEAYGYEIKKMFINDNENLTHKGIICKLSLKVKMFNGKLNAILRECSLIRNEGIQNLKIDEKLQLESIHKQILERIPQRALVWNFHSYAICVPLVKQSNETITLKYETQVTPDEIHINESLDSDDDFDTISQLEDYEVRSHLDVTRNINQYNNEKLVKGDDFNELNLANPKDNIVYEIDCQIMNIKYNMSYLSILVTNDFVTNNFIDPTRMLRIDITNVDNLKQLLDIQISETQLTDIIKDKSNPIIAKIDDLINESVVLRIKRKLVQLSLNSKLAIWNPYTCTSNKHIVDQYSENVQVSNVITVKKEQ